MRLKVSGLRLKLDQPLAVLQSRAAEVLRVPPVQVKDLKITRESVDARRREIFLVYTVEVTVADHLLEKKRLIPGSQVQLATHTGKRVVKRGTEKMPYPPVVVGAGPAGLFAALTLAVWGYIPLLLERGRDVERRTEDVKRFWEQGIPDHRSNVQFGEGGAGTFSDGKLTTRIKDARVAVVLKQLIAAGAPPEIAYRHKPHLGTDKLKDIVKALREKIISLGGRVYFESQVTDIVTRHNRVEAVTVNGEQEVKTSAVVLAIGHSARDTYAMLCEKVDMEQKPFALGVRIEHPQQLIDRGQYGDYAGHPRLGPADYYLTYRDRESGRSAYTFCMCPGGYVVAGASEPDTVVTNGMSESRRDSGIANSAVVVTVDEKDFSGDHVLAGVELQQQLERSAFILGGGNYFAPTQRVEDFFADRTGDLAITVRPTYKPGVTPANFNECLPKELTETLARALKAFDKKIPGFAGDDIPLTGVETRTSAPVRILRDRDTQAVNVMGLYPAGEGAGYAGGIVSAAVDGVRVAENIIQRFAPPGD